jgi:hypothetical protein
MVQKTTDFLNHLTHHHAFSLCDIRNTTTGYYGAGAGGGGSISRAGTTRNAYRVDLSKSYGNKRETSENQWEAEPCLIRFVTGIDFFTGVFMNYVMFSDFLRLRDDYLPRFMHMFITKLDNI